MSENTADYSECRCSVSLRDWLAAHALAAIVAKNEIHNGPELDSLAKRAAKGAYVYADAMLVERSK